MSTVGIICEYNPPHNGHAYQIAEIKRRFPECAVVCVMSGCFVQRGTPAVLSPGARARTAVALGADVVIELPPQNALAPAELFARGGVAALAALGVDTLCFGAEPIPNGTDLTAVLTEAAERLDSTVFRCALDAEKENEENAATGSPILRERVYRQLYGDDATAVLKTPNNILGIEYIRAVRKFGADMTPLAIPRIGVSHDAPLSDSETELASASAVRDCLYCGDARALSYLPSVSASVLAEETAAGRIVLGEGCVLDALILHHYRTTPAAVLCRYADLSGGFASRLCRAAKDVTTYADFCHLARVKHMTDAAVRRAILCGFFGITRKEQKEMPQYLSLLARADSAHAATVLRRASKESPIPLLTKPAAYKTLDPLARQSAERDFRVNALWGMLCAKPIAEAEWFRRRV